MTWNEPQPPPPPGRWLRPELAASWREITLVILVMVGPFAWRSSVAAWQGSATRFIPVLFSDNRLLGNLVFEAVLLSFFLWLLHRRGWNVSDLRIRLKSWGWLQGVALWIAVVTCAFVTKMSLLVALFFLQAHKQTFLQFMLANNPHLVAHSITVSWSMLIAAMLLNAYFEEIICTGYVFTQLAEKWGPSFGLAGTLALRLACHTYQGPVNVVAIGTVFLLFGLCYWWTRNLWTLVVAHALLDISSGAILKLLYG